jgi:hypothetical protein
VYILSPTERKCTALLQIQDLDDPIFGQEHVPSGSHAQPHGLTGLSLRSSSHPMALVKSPFPSDNKSTSSLILRFSFQAFMTKASLTEMKSMVLTPLALSYLDLTTKPGRCFWEQVGVKASGTAKRMAFSCSW